MTIPFYKFDGAGNDFVIINTREQAFPLTGEQIARICHRRFGVGADGLMLLESPDDSTHRFKMRYFNADGSHADMCGNGGRCIAALAHILGLSDKNRDLDFIASDGPHHAHILMWDETVAVGIVQLGMRDVPANEVSRMMDGWKLNTGVPHYVQRVEDLAHFDVVEEGRRLRHHPDFGPEGTNVDFIEDLPDGRLWVRTYERGVEDETWACGTGVTAAAIVSGNGNILTRGGDFKVSFTPTGSTYSNLLLTGPAALNFTGSIDI